MTTPTPSLGTTIRIGPAVGRVWHDMGGVRLSAPRHVIVTSHIYRAVEQSDIEWLDAPQSESQPTPLLDTAKISTRKPTRKPRRKAPAKQADPDHPNHPDQKD